MNIFAKIFRYFEPAWTGKDRRISLRSVLAIVFSIDFVRNINYAIFKWDAGRSLEGLSLTLGIEAGLIVGLLGLTTYQNLATFGKTDSYYSNSGNTTYPGTPPVDIVTKVEEKPGTEVSQ